MALEVVNGARRMGKLSRFCLGKDLLSPVVNAGRYRYSQAAKLKALVNGINSLRFARRLSQAMEAILRCYRRGPK
jgi:hypothetical protein